MYQDQTETEVAKMLDPPLYPKLHKNGKFWHNLYHNMPIRSNTLIIVKSYTQTKPIFFNFPLHLVLAKSNEEGEKAIKAGDQ